MRSPEAVSTASMTSNGRRKPASPAKRELGSPELRARIEHLLQRYPDISQEETQELLTFLKSGPHLDVGLVTGEDAVREKVREFRTRHEAEFRLKAHEIMMFVAFICGPFVYLGVKYLLL